MGKEPCTFGRVMLRRRLPGRGISEGYQKRQRICAVEGPVERCRIWDAVDKPAELACNSSID